MELIRGHGKMTELRCRQDAPVGEKSRKMSRGKTKVKSSSVSASPISSCVRFCKSFLSYFLVVVVNFSCQNPSTNSSGDFLTVQLLLPRKCHLSPKSWRTCQLRVSAIAIILICNSDDKVVDQTPRWHSCVLAQ